MRTVKTPQDRREDFLEAARALFEERGVDETSVSDIIAKVGVAKGTFYWHFKSKEALLEALAERRIGLFLETIEPILADPGRNALEKLRDLWRVHEKERHTRTSLQCHVHKPENLLLHQKVRDIEAKALVPLLAEVIGQGNREGLFTTVDPETTAAFLIMAQGLRLRQAEITGKPEADTREDAAQDILERVLGAAPGSLAFLSHG
ncbi:transcriptional regulator, TetR family [Solidesulfovibrio fructosivorans JJ]]|uniref:Transcriptional regulator, TetR family n=1 Tax=Solidesulfovibrio fructosivorans JJ] TaxID=596151 RepID=E1K154_SOLFR|nr:TetR/AcrR family transcriptional regulator [Solidesulfovibrio fructosivorans]EFL49681.1 transcriptional regulator, TetR family [Solidesulfovibrio fructosivorans JJ]]